MLSTPSVKKSWQAPIVLRLLLRTPPKNQNPSAFLSWLLIPFGFWLYWVRWNHIFKLLSDHKARIFLSSFSSWFKHESWITSSPDSRSSEFKNESNDSRLNKIRTVGNFTRKHEKLLCWFLQENSACFPFVRYTASPAKYIKYSRTYKRIKTFLWQGLKDKTFFKRGAFQSKAIGKVAIFHSLYRTVVLFVWRESSLSVF